MSAYIKIHFLDTYRGVEIEHFQYAEIDEIREGDNYIQFLLKGQNILHCKIASLIGWSHIPKKKFDAENPDTQSWISKPKVEKKKRSRVRNIKSRRCERCHRNKESRIGCFYCKRFVCRNCLSSYDSGCGKDVCKSCYKSRDLGD